MQGHIIRAWGGRQADRKYLRRTWMPYNPGSKLDAGIPGDIFQYSTFSSASAAVLKLFTAAIILGFRRLSADFGRVERGSVLSRL